LKKSTTFLESKNQGLYNCVDGCKFKEKLSYNPIAHRCPYGYGVIGYEIIER